MDPDNDNDNDNSDSSSIFSEEAEAQVSRRCTYAALLVMALSSAVKSIVAGWFDKQAYHTSVLSGEAWVMELLTGHPDRIYTELGVRIHVFEALIDALRALGLEDSREVKLEEQLSIFLYMCVTGLTIRHVGERFQHSNDTISK